MRQQIQFCQSFDDTCIAYGTAGTGPPLVRVGSWLTHLKMDWEGPIWSHWFSELSSRHTLIRYDSRGSGLSDRSPDDLSLEAYVRDLESVVDDIELDRFPLLGFCQGGLVAAAYAAKHPERVSRLILFGSYPRGGLVDDAPPQEQREAETLAEMIAVGWGHQTEAFRQVFVKLLMPEATEEQISWLAELERMSVSTEMAARLWRTYQSFDIRRVAPRLQVPALVFHVENDAMVPFEFGRRLASLIPGACFVPLPGNNHILRSDEPAWEQFVSELRDFLSSERPHRSSMPSHSRANGAAAANELLGGDNEGDSGTGNGAELSAANGGFEELTPREHEVLELMARGISNNDIAERLCISPKTVRNHITRIFSKLQVERRAQAIVQAREAGIGRNGAS